MSYPLLIQFALVEIGGYMSDINSRMQQEQAEVLRLINLGYYLVVKHHPSVNLHISQRVAHAHLEDSTLHLVVSSQDPVPPQTHILHITAIKLKGDRIRIWTLVDGQRTDILQLQAYAPNEAQFLAELNAARSRLGYGPWLTAQQRVLQSAAHRLTTRAIGKTITEIQALDGLPTGYRLVFDDGSSVVLRADINGWEAMDILKDRYREYLVARIVVDGT